MISMTRLARTGALSAALAMALAGLVALGGCAAPASDNAAANADGAAAQSAAAEESISLYSREDGSGTRGAFVELIGLEEEDASGNKVDMTSTSAAITNSTSVMMTSVASDPAAIGYISLGSLNDTVKAVAIDGVEPTASHVKDGSYAIARPFNIVTTDNPSPEAADFISYIMSSDGQAVVEGEGYVAVDDSASPYQASGVAGKIVVAGSSSVTPVMEKLAEAYQAVNPGATVEVQQSDSTTGVNMAVEGTCDIGMASRDLKDSETAAGAASTAIAQDGIAVIVSPGSSVDSLTTDQVRDIFAGTIANWGDVA